MDVWLLRPQEGMDMRLAVVLLGVWFMLVSQMAARVAKWIPDDGSWRAAFRTLGAVMVILVYAMILLLINRLCYAALLPWMPEWPPHWLLLAVWCVFTTARECVRIHRNIGWVKYRVVRLNAPKCKDV
jgi:hypothetical protein